MQAGPPDAKTGVQKAEDAEEELRRKSTQVVMLMMVMTLWNCVDNQIYFFLKGASPFPGVEIWQELSGRH